MYIINTYIYIYIYILGRWLFADSTSSAEGRLDAAALFSLQPAENMRIGL